MSATGMVPLDLVVDLAAAVKAGEMTVEEADLALQVAAAESEGDPT